jgi:hypothetical protein
MTQAVAGHGATVAAELDPVGAAGVFTVIAELNGDITFPSLSRPETDATPHQDTIDSWVLGVPTRGPLNFTVNYIFDDPTHDSETGLIAMFTDGLRRGWRIRGPGGGPSSDEWIASGQVQNIGPITNPVRTGVRSAAVTVRLSGPMIIDGAPYTGG